MSSLGNRAIILPMPRSLSPTKVLLIADGRFESRDPRAASIRRYRLARMRLDPDRVPAPPRIMRKPAS
jgi:hypothetical protein